MTLERWVTGRDEGRRNFGQWYLHKQENMGKVEKQEVVQFVWSIEGHAGVVGNKGISIPYLTLNVLLRHLYSIQLSVD